MIKYVNLIVLIISVIIFNNPACSQEESNEVESFGFNDKGRKFQLSMFALASNPNEYNNKQVFISGYVSYSYGFRVFTDKSSCKDSFLVNSIGVNVNVGLYEEYKAKYTQCEIFNILGQFVKTNEYGQDKFVKLTIGDIDPVVNISSY